MLKTILELIGFSIIVLVGYNLLKAFVLSKIKVNKWVILVIAIAVLILSSVIPALLNTKVQGTIVTWISGGIFIILFLWFLDLSGFNNRYEANSNTTAWGKKNKKDKIVIRPKAKPNRINKNK